MCPPRRLHYRYITVTLPLRVSHPGAAAPSGAFGAFGARPHIVFAMVDDWGWDLFPGHLAGKSDAAPKAAATTTPKPVGPEGAAEDAATASSARDGTGAAWSSARLVVGPGWCWGHAGGQASGWVELVARWS